MKATSDGFSGGLKGLNRDDPDAAWPALGTGGGPQGGDGDGEDDSNGSGTGRGLSANVLVLNKFYVPIHVTTARRAFVLVYKGDAEAISLLGDRVAGFDFENWVAYSLTEPCEDDEYVLTVSCRIRVPRIVRLLGYERLPRVRVNFSRKNVFARDEYRCQYCGTRASGRELTLDHVTPRSRGGKHCWTNVVACCTQCNDRKGGLTPREVGMRLLREPLVPKRPPEIKRRLAERKYRIWRVFLN